MFLSFFFFFFFFFLEREQNKYGTLIAGLGRVALKTSGTVLFLLHLTSETGAYL